MRTQTKNSFWTCVVMASVTTLSACGVEDSSEGSLGDKADGLGDFDKEDVHLEFKRNDYFCEHDMIFEDSRCDANLDHPVLATANVRIGGTNRALWSDEITIETNDNRVLLPAGRGIKIDGFSDTIELNTRIGLKIDFRVDGESEWRTADWLTSVNYPGRNHLSEVTFWPAEGLGEGTLVYSCEGSWCTRPSDIVFAYGGISPETLIEYRVVFMPIWQIGDFREGKYEFGFRVSPADSNEV